MIKPIGRKQLIVGTAQLGLPRYGIANTAGRPDDAVAFLHEAFAAGVGGVDCAPAYGSAEEIVGQALPAAPDDFTVVTKLFPRDRSDESAASIRSSVENSRRLLRLDTLPIFLLHDWQHRHARHGLIWQTLLALRAEGLIERLGVSAHSPSEACEAIDDPDIQHLQMPCNLLDDRWEDVPPRLADRPDLTVHVRSAFLQGVLFLPPGQWPHTPEQQASELSQKIRQLSLAHGRRDTHDFALAWARSQPWVHGVVVGMETSAQLRANLDLFDTPLLNPDTLPDIRRELAGAPPLLLDPSTWPN